MLLSIFVLSFITKYGFGLSFPDVKTLISTRRPCDRSFPDSLTDTYHCIQCGTNGAR